MRHVRAVRKERRREDRRFYRKNAFFRCPVCKGRHGITTMQFFRSEEKFCRCKSCGAPLYLQGQSILVFTAACAAELLILQLLRRFSINGFLAVRDALRTVTLNPSSEEYDIRIGICIIHFLEGALLVWLLHPVRATPPPPPPPSYSCNGFFRKQTRYETITIAIILILWLKLINLIH